MSDGRITIDIEIDGKKIKAVVQDIKELEQVSKASSKGVDEVKESVKEVDGKKVKDVAVDMKDLKKTSEDGAKSVTGVSDSIEKVDGKPIEDAGKDAEGFSKKSEQATKSTKSFVVALLAVKAAGMVFNALASSMDGAISRFDTFQKFPKIMEALGFGAEESKDAIDQLSGAIDGLPTTLDEIVASTQKFVGINGSLSRSTTIAEGLNNAFLASGASAADAARGSEQYSQMLQNGTVDMMSWRSINETMGTSLNYVAKEMLGTSASSMDLYNNIKGGEIAFRDFEDQLIAAGTGTGHLAQLARENSKGIATSIGNLKNATVKGMASILESLDAVVKSTSGKNIAENLDATKVIVNKTFKAVGKSIELTIPLVELLADSFKLLYKTGKVLSPALIGVAASFAAYKVIKTVSNNVSDYTEALAIAKKATELLTIETLAQVGAENLSIASKAKLGIASKAEIAAATAELVAKKAQIAGSAAGIVVTEAEIAAHMASSGVLTKKAAIVGFLTGQYTLAEIASASWAVTTKVLSGALTFLSTNPIGMAVSAIGILVGAGAALYKWFSSTSGSAEEMAESIDASREKVDDLTKSVKKTANARKEEINYSKDQIGVYKGVAESIINLARQEKLSTKEKNDMKSSISDLNREFTELSLVYDENTGNLNMNEAALMGIIEQYSNLENVSKITSEMAKNEEEARAIKEQLLEVQKEQNTLWDDATVARYKIKQAEEELQAQEAELMESQRLNAEEYKYLQEEKLAAFQAAAEAESLALANQMITYENLSEYQKQTVDTMASTWQSYSAAATEMFSTLSDKQTMSVWEMQQNLDENQRIIGQWGVNIATLTSRGVDEGLLQTLQEAGPQSAGYVAALVNASDAELAGLNTSFKNGGEVATKALRDAFGLGAQEIPAEVMSMVTAAKSTLTEEIQAADFGSLGKNIPKGAAEGIKQGTPDVEKANEEMGKKGADSFKKATDQHSPSRLYHKMGGYIVEGLVNGIRSKESQPADALRHLATRMKSMFTPLPNDMRSIGMNASYGLAAGINAGAGAALSAARNLANQVSATMKSSLKIHSPSRLMRDEIGRFIPQGLALGIEADSATAINALKNLGNDLMGAINPEKALGLNGMAFASTAGQIINNSNSSPVTIDNRGLLEGAIFHVREEADIERIAEELDKRTTQKATGLGFRRGIGR